MFFLGGDKLMEKIIEIKNVNKFYGRKQALHNITLTIHQGMFGLLGRKRRWKNDAHEDSCHTS